MPRKTRIHRGQTRSPWVVAALVSILAIAAVAGLCGCAEKSAEHLTTGVDQAKDVAAKAALSAVATGVRAHVATTGEAPADASRATLGGFVSPWPDNPFTGAPMSSGSNPGDYVYRRLEGGAYELAVYLFDGTLSPAP